MKDLALEEDLRSWSTVQVSEAPNSLYIKVGKRVTDVTLAVLLLPVLAPIIGVLYLLTRRDGGPGFFGHRRIGKNGKAFKCWKIRTMVMDAEAKLRIHLRENPEAAAEWQRDFKLTNDPRVTRLGCFLRKTSLDELPQIWNVLKGEMSFVGPRPIIRTEMPKYSGHQRAYTAMKPGVTGVWQVSGRNDVDYAERVAMDVAYLRRAGFWFDLGVIAKTAGAVVNRTGR